ncbi:MAG: hypothetical protein AAGA95_19565, partial [Pseudomonadota bacterium]
RFSPDGFPEGGIPLAVQDTPFGLATDGTDLFAIISNRLDRFSTDGDYLGTIASDFASDPITLQIDPVGNFYVASADDSVTKLSPDGEVLVQITNLNDPFGANGDASGNIYASVRNEMRIYDATGQFLEAIPTGFTFNSAIAIDHERDRLFHAAQNALLQTYDLSSGRPVFVDELAIPSGGISLAMSYDPNTDHLFVGGTSSAYQITTEGMLVQQYARNLISYGVVAVPVPEPGYIGPHLFAVLTMIALVRRRQRFDGIVSSRE